MPDVGLIRHWTFITSPVRMARPMTLAEHRAAQFAPPLDPSPAPGTPEARALVAHWMEHGRLPTPVE